MERAVPHGVLPGAGLGDPQQVDAAVLRPQAPRRRHGLLSEHARQGTEEEEVDEEEEERQGGLTVIGIPCSRTCTCS